MECVVVLISYGTIVTTFKMKMFLILYFLHIVLSSKEIQLTSYILTALW